MIELTTFAHENSNDPKNCRRLGLGPQAANFAQEISKVVIEFRKGGRTGMTQTLGTLQMSEPEAITPHMSRQCRQARSDEGQRFRRHTARKPIAASFIASGPGESRRFPSTDKCHICCPFA